MDMLSVISLIVTIILGGYAIYQSWKYNKDSEKINEDTKYMIIQQIRMLNELDKNISASSSDKGIYNLKKDEIKFHKLSKFSKSDIGRIKDAISHLKIKGVFLKKVEDYLNGDNTDYQCNFWSKAEADGEVSIEELYAILLKYNILISIVYH